MSLMDRKHLEELRRQLADLEAELSLPDTASNPSKLRELMTEHAHLKQLLEKGDTYFDILDQIQGSRQLLEEADSDDDLRAMAEEDLARLDNERPEAEKSFMRALIPPDPVDHRNTIMEIRAGTGGEEAALFAGDLYRMYSRYAEANGWKIEVIDASESSIGGFKEVVFSVIGESVYRKLRYESGGHRVQRIPVTETSGRIHTSAATVAVLPEAEEVDSIDIDPEDIRIDLFCASGPGGQKVNKTTSAVRITHLETGLVVQSQDERSQHRNKDRAMQVLKARLLDRKRSEAAAKEAGERKSQIGSGDRSERIRTYNFPQNRLTDHRINLTLYHLDRVMEGELGEIIDALQERDMALRMEQEIQSSE